MNTLIMSAATALISAMATDKWKDASEAIAGLWPSSGGDMRSVQAELETVRASVVAARRDRDRITERELVHAWQQRLGRLIGENPSVVAGLSAVLEDELLPLLAAEEESRAQEIVLNATATGNSSIFQAGRDMHIDRE